MGRMSANGTHPGGESTAKCVICGQPGVAYAQSFNNRRKGQSYPVCVQHALLGYGLEQLLQDLVRTNVSRAFGIRKGSIPRFKIRLKP